MDPERQIRFLYPPLCLVASLAWGVWLDPLYGIAHMIPAELVKDTTSTVLTVVAGGGIVVTALGLLINTIPWALLRLFAHVFYGQSHEAILSRAALERIQGIVGYPHAPAARDALFLVATFDHDKLPQSIHRWLLRRWNAFNVNASVVSAVVLALALGWRLGISVSREWILTSLVVGVVFTWMAWWAWRDTMGMLEFQSETVASPDRAGDLPTPNARLQPTAAGATASRRG